MTKIKTKDLTGPALDWAVARAEGRRVEVDYQYTEEKKFDGWWQLGPNHWQPLNNYSTNWSQGGPIIERERISLNWLVPAHKSIKGCWAADCRTHIRYGPTPLIAAMRCFCASRLGDEVDVPEEVLS